MFKKITLLSLLFAAVASSCNNGGGAGSGAAVKLSFNPTVGKEYVMKSDIVMDMTTMGMPIKSTMSFEMSMKASDKEGDLNVVKSKFKRYKMNMSTGMMGDMSFDSDNPDASSPMFESLSKLTSAEYTQKMDQTGAIKSIEGLDSLLGGQMAGQMKNSMGQGMASLPNKEVKPGDTWNSETVTDLNGMKMALKNEWTLTKVEGNIAFLDVKSTFATVEGSTAPAGIDGFDIDGEQSGTAEVEVATGMTTKADFKQKATITMKVSGQEVKADLKMDIKMTCEL